jgi:hypothetical protein
MHGDLRVQRVREQAGLGVVEGQPGFVTGGFDTEDKHGVSGAAGSARAASAAIVPAKSEGQQGSTPGPGALAGPHFDTIRLR